MTKRPTFECDGCGDRFGARNDVQEVPIRVRGEDDSEFIPPSDEVLHLCRGGCFSPDIEDVLQSGYTHFLLYGPYHDPNVVGLLHATKTIHRSKELTVKAHGNVAIIEDAMADVENILSRRGDG